MFNKTIQEVKCENDYYKEKIIEELPNQKKGNRECELVLIITHKQNYFKVYPWNDKFKDMFFDNLKEAKSYFKKVSLIPISQKG